jgi:uncharacterized protein (TIGR04255 family)
MCQRQQDERVQSVARDEGGGEPQVRAQQRVRFENREATFGYLLAADQLITHQSSYTNFEDLCDNVRRGFQAVIQHANIPFITRIGLRYIDLITARPGETVDEYVQPQFRAFAPDLPAVADGAAERRGSVQLIEWKYPRSRVLFKVYRGTHTDPLPVDLKPVSLRFSRCPSKDRESLIFDIDHFVEELRTPPDWLLVGELIRQLQEPMSQIFGCRARAVGGSLPKCSTAERSVASDSRRADARPITQWKGVIVHSASAQSLGRSAVLGARSW